MHAVLPLYFPSSAKAHTRRLTNHKLAYLSSIITVIVMCHCLTSFYFSLNICYFPSASPSLVQSHQLFFHFSSSHFNTHKGQTNTFQTYHCPNHARKNRRKDHQGSQREYSAKEKEKQESPPTKQSPRALPFYGRIVFENSQISQTNLAQNSVARSPRGASPQFLFFVGVCLWLVATQQGT